MYQITRETRREEQAEGADDEQVNLDFHIVSEDGVVKHIEMIEK